MNSRSLLVVLVVLLFTGELCQCEDSSLLSRLSSSIMHSLMQTRFWMDLCDCPKLDRPTCGSRGNDLVTYTNRCYFECARSQDPAWALVSSSPCDHRIP
ncbi:unnamed protein product [Phyllotreta striolata]|uniref:Kazal-like domain-containing protein n=1 Tax=Phyllotreta striolata TaxID=444603 RepID=A0A9N9TTH3_PHYSR|nr:unnamed protein product [Phyllotreta striolata]